MNWFLTNDDSLFLSLHNCFEVDTIENLVPYLLRSLNLRLVVVLWDQCSLKFIVSQEYDFEGNVIYT